MHRLKEWGVDICLKECGAGLFDGVVWGFAGVSGLVLGACPLVPFLLSSQGETVGGCSGCKLGPSKEPQWLLPVFNSHVCRLVELRWSCLLSNGWKVGRGTGFALLTARLAFSITGQFHIWEL